MKRQRILRGLGLLIVFVLTWGSTSSANVAGLQQATIAGPYVPGEILVKLRAGVAPEGAGAVTFGGAPGLSALAARFGVASVTPLFPEHAAAPSGLERIYKLSLPAEGDLLAAIQAFSGDPAVEYVEPNYIYQVAEVNQQDQAEAAVPQEQTPPPSNTTPRPADQLLSNEEFLFASAVLDFDLQAFLDTQAGPLGVYSEQIDGESWSAAEIVRYCAMTYGINPQVLLLVLEARGGYLSDTNSSMPDPAAVAQGQPAFFDQVDELGRALQSAYDEHRFQQSKSQVTLSDGRQLAVDPATNSATYALQTVLGQLLTADAWEQWVAGPDALITERFTQLFPVVQSPSQLEPAVTTPITITGLFTSTMVNNGFKLPFPANETWHLSSGPHHYHGTGHCAIGTSKQRCGAGAWSSIDIVPVRATACVSGSTSLDADAWIVAAHSGRVVESSRARLVIDHGNNLRTYYSHVSSTEKAGLNTVVKQGQRIGHPSCEVEPGGSTTGIHIHFAVYSSAVGFLDIAGSRLSDWRVYEGTHYNGGITKTAILSTTILTRTANSSRVSTGNNRNDVYNAYIIPNDQLFEYQYGLHNVDASSGQIDADIDGPEAWGAINFTPATLVAVVDTGIYYTHDDLKDGRVRTDLDWDYVNNDGDALDDHGRGTQVAGIIAAKSNNGIGIAGVMQSAYLLPVKACDKQGNCTADHVAQAVRYAADKGARVINLSMGGFACSNALTDAINYAHFTRGAVVVAAAGDKAEGISFPASIDAVIAVGASDRRDVLASSSNRGAEQDVVAPGKDIWTTAPRNGYDSLSGTSMAAPFVAGVAGTLIAQRPTLSNEQVRDILRQSADDRGTAGFDKLYGYGRVNLFRALQTPAPTAPKPSVGGAACPGCGATVAATQGADGDMLLANIRALRDGVFQQDPGRRWARIYYENQLEVALMVATDTGLSVDVLAGWREFDPVFQRLMDDQAPPVTLTPELIATASEVMMGVAARGSPAVRAAIVSEWQRVDPQRFVGWEVRDVWAQLVAENESTPQVYLPSLRP